MRVNRKISQLLRFYYITFKQAAIVQSMRASDVEVTHKN